MEAGPTKSVCSLPLLTTFLSLICSEFQSTQLVVLLSLARLLTIPSLWSCCFAHDACHHPHPVGGFIYLEHGAQISRCVFDQINCKFQLISSQMNAKLWLNHFLSGASLDFLRHTWSCLPLPHPQYIFIPGSRHLLHIMPLNQAVDP